MFGKWFAEPDTRTEALIVHYPGRGSRHNEQPIKRIHSLVEQLSQAIQPYLDEPFAFFGHSLGGLIAFELARQLRRQNLPQPQVLFISGCGAPHLPDPHPSIHKLPDPEFINALLELNGIPPEVAHHSELMEILLPSLRADFEAFESYRYSPGEHNLACPIITFGGLDDPRVSRERLEGWASHTTAKFRSQYFFGGHFFINANKADVIASITTELTSSHAER